MLVALEGTVSLYVPLFLSLINGAGESVKIQKHRSPNARGSERMRYRTASVRSREKLLERTLEPVFSNGTGQAAM